MGYPSHWTKCVVGLRIVGWICPFLLLSFLNASGFLISDVRRSGGTIEIDHPAIGDAYYILYSGTHLDALSTPVRISAAMLPKGTFSDASAATNPDGIAFYSVRKVPLVSPLDSDGDTIDDAFELSSSVLDPLEAADAALDPDSDGVDSLTEYLQGRNPAAGATPDIHNVIRLDLFTPLDP